MTQLKGWQQVYLAQIESCEENESQLNDWERGFIASCRSRVEDTQPLSAAQVDKLDEIWERFQ